MPVPGHRTRERRPQRRAGGVRCSTRPRLHRDGFIPSLLSCVHVCPAPPVGTHTPSQLPCWNDTPPPATTSHGARVQAMPGPTGSTLVRLRLFNHRRTFAGTGHHSGRHTPCAVSLILRCSSHVGRTTSRPGRPGIAEAPAPTRFAVPRWDRFQGTEYRSAPLPLLVRPFPVRLRLCCG